MSMSSYQRGCVFTLILAIPLAFIAIVLFTTMSNSDQQYLSDRLFKQKAEVLQFTASDQSLSKEARAVIFDYLNGEQMLQYDFSPEERIQIIHALNKR